MEGPTRMLIEHASRGDARAVEDLLERFLPDLRGYLQRHAGALVHAKESNSDLAQSVCREVLERLASERFVYQGDGEFKQWLLNAALYKIRARQRFYLAAMRDAGRESTSPRAGASTDSDLDALPVGSSVATPSAAASDREEIQRLRTALERLPANYREVIQLAHVEGLSHQEIGARLGISETNSRVLLSRAIAKLATLGVRPN